MGLPSEIGSEYSRPRAGIPSRGGGRWQTSSAAASGRVDGQPGRTRGARCRVPRPRLDQRALDIARAAHFAQEDWEPALRRIDAILEVERALRRPAEEIALVLMNRANVLVRLSRFGEAKTELEACLRIFENSPAERARVLGSPRQAAVDQFLEQARQAASG